VVDLVELGEAFDAARVDGDEPLEVPVVLDGERDPLLVRERPEDGGIDRAAEVRVKLGEARAADLLDDGLPGRCLRLRDGPSLRERFALRVGRTPQRRGEKLV